MKYFISFIWVLTSIPALVFSQTARITFTSPKLYPEGTCFDAAGNRFFVSSEKKGQIGTVDMQGNYQVFYQDTTLKSSFGMKIEPKKNELWVCTGDPQQSIYSTPETHRKLARVIGLDLKTGKKLDDIDLSQIYPGDHFLNDLVLDDSGNKYVTDSYSPVIYLINSEGKASVFASNPLFSGKGIGLNGIVWDPAGYIIAINDANGDLYRISLKQPAPASLIQTTQRFVGGDGMIFDRGKLYVVQNKGVNVISLLETSDHWQHAIVKGRTSVLDRFQNPSTLTVQGSTVYALNAKLNELMDSTINPSNEFSLQQVIIK